MELPELHLVSAPTAAADAAACPAYFTTGPTKSALTVNLRAQALRDVKGSKEGSGPACCAAHAADATFGV